LLKFRFRNHGMSFMGTPNLKAESPHMVANRQNARGSNKTHQIRLAAVGRHVGKRDV
jgi:hypothetical protein